MQYGLFDRAYRLTLLRILCRPYSQSGLHSLWELCEHTEALEKKLWYAMRACLVYEANLANCAHVDTLMKLSQKVEQVPFWGKSARLLAQSEAA